jgi:hypothetical protein
MVAGFFRVQEVDHIPTVDGTARPFVTYGGAPQTDGGQTGEHQRCNMFTVQ